MSKVSPNAETISVITKPTVLGRPMFIAMVAKMIHGAMRRVRATRVFMRSFLESFVSMIGVWAVEVYKNIFRELLKTPVRPELVEGQRCKLLIQRSPLMVRQAHHERECGF